MEFKNEYSLQPAEQGVLNLMKNGKPCMCRLTQPIPVQANIATKDKSFALQFTPCNTTCPNMNIRPLKSESGEEVPHVIITCGAGVKYPVSFAEEKPASELQIVK